MRTTLTIDDQLFAKAVALAEPGIGKYELIRECVKAFIQRQSARRLAASGGQQNGAHRLGGPGQRHSL